MQLGILPDVALDRDQARLQALRNGAGKHRQNPAEERKRLKQAASEFEGMMLEIMVKAMRKNVPDSPLLGSSNEREIFTEMLDSQYVKLMVDRGGIGLADMLVQQLGTKP